MVVLVLVLMLMLMLMLTLTLTLTLAHAHAHAHAHTTLEFARAFRVGFHRRFAAWDATQPRHRSAERPDGAAAESLGEQAVPVSGAAVRAQAPPPPPPYTLGPGPEP